MKIRWIHIWTPDEKKNNYNNNFMTQTNTSLVQNQHMPHELCKKNILIYTQMGLKNIRENRPKKYCFFSWNDWSRSTLGIYCTLEILWFLYLLFCLLILLFLEDSILNSEYNKSTTFWGEIFKKIYFFFIMNNMIERVDLSHWKKWREEAVPPCRSSRTTCQAHTISV